MLRLRQNSKSQALNPKQIQNSKIQMPNNEAKSAEGTQVVAPATRPSKMTAGGKSDADLRGESLRLDSESRSDRNDRAGQLTLNIM